MLFTILVFIILLGILVFVHELGHFVMARRLGVKAEEFGFGFPPRLIGIQFRSDGEKGWRLIWGNREFKEATIETNEHWGTVYSLNWIPLGGFVKIKGENGEEKNEPDSFAGQKIWKRATILSAGVTMNVVLCAVALMIAFMVGAPQIIEDVAPDAMVRDSKIQVISLLKDSPAEKSGVQLGDAIVSIDGVSYGSIVEVQKYLQNKEKQEVVIEVEHFGQKKIFKLQPVVLAETQKPGLGVGLARTGIVSYPWYKAVWLGGRDTYYLGKQIIIAFATVIKNAIIGQPIGVDVAGPVGIAVITGQVARLGFVYILQFMALLSLNLAIINFLPFPALDGGRVLFLIIEKIRGQAVNQKVEQVIHNIGFTLLMILVLVVTSRDLLRFKDFFLNLWQRLT